QLVLITFPSASRLGSRVVLYHSAPFSVTIRERKAKGKQKAICNLGLPFSSLQPSKNLRSDFREMLPLFCPSRAPLFHQSIKALCVFELGKAPQSGKAAPLRKALFEDFSAYLFGTIHLVPKN